MILSDEELLKIMQGLRKEMREIAEEKAREIMDEHLTDYRHQEVPANE